MARFILHFDLDFDLPVAAGYMATLLEHANLWRGDKCVISVEFANTTQLGNYELRKLGGKDDTTD